MSKQSSSVANVASAKVPQSLQGFYITGGTLPGSALSYVTRQADHQLYEGLCQGQFCYVLTSRQMGKSSLMIRTAARLREAGIGAAVLDLTAIGQNLTAEQWYDGLLNRIGLHLQLEEELEEFWQQNARLGPLQRWMNAITEVVLPRYPGRLVIFVDEIDTVRSLPFSTDEFFAGIREFHNRRTAEPEMERLTFCLLGVAAPSDLIRDTRTTPFNIGQRIELNDFSQDEANWLAAGLGQDEATGALLMQRIMHWTNGHPYLTQRLCHELAEDQSVTDANGVDQKCAELFFAEGAETRDNNLLFVRERLLRSEVELAGLLTLYGQIHKGKAVAEDETNPLVTVLRLSGVTRSENKRLSVRNRIYERVFDREWVRQNMPDAELRRQRAAYRKGLLRAAAVAALVLAVIGVLAFAAVWGQRKAVAQQKIAEQERAVAQQQRNRADGNAERLTVALSETEQQRQEAINQQMIAEEQRSLADEQRMLAENQKDINYRQLYVAQMNLAGQAWELSNIGRMNELVDRYLPQPGQPDVRGFEWHLLWNLGFRDVPVLHFDNQVRSVSITPDSKKLVTMSMDGVKIWDLSTRRELHVLKGHAGMITQARLSPNGRLLATSSNDRTAKLWDLSSGRELLTLTGPSQPVNNINFSPDSRRLVTVNRAGPRSSARVWDVLSGKELVTLQGEEQYLLHAVFSPDGRLIATANNNGSAKLWDAATGTELLTLNKPLTNDNRVPVLIVFSPDGKKLATNIQGTISMWDVLTRKELFNLKGGMAQLSFSPDSTRIVISGITDEGGTRMLDAITGKQLMAFNGQKGFVRQNAFSPDGLRLVTISDDAVITLWDVRTGRQLTSLKGHTALVIPPVFSPDGHWLATGSFDKTVRLWDLSVRPVPAAFDGVLYESETFAPGGNRLLTGSLDITTQKSTLKLWNIESGMEITEIKPPDDIISDADISPDGRLLVTAAGDTTIRLWDAATGQERMMIKPHKNWDLNMKIKFSRDGRKLVTGTTDFTWRIFDVATGKILFVQRGHRGIIEGLDISTDGRMIATGGHDRTAKLWDMESGKELWAITGHNAIIYALALSRDGRFLATGGDDRLIKIWDIVNRKELMTLSGHSGFVSSVAFSPDGRRLASGGADAAAKLWDLTTGQEVLTLREHQGPVRVAFNHDGTILATSGRQDNRTLLWRTPKK